MSKSDDDDDWRSKPDRANAPLDYATRGASLWMNPNRPKTLSLVAYVAIAIGYIGFIWKPLTLTPFVIDARKINPNYIYPDLTPMEYVGAIVWVIVGAAFSLVQIAGGIGTLKMRRWGVKLLAIYALAAITMSLLQAGHRLIYFDRWMELQAGATTQAVNMREMQQGGALVVVVGTAALLLWPIIILTVLTRKHVRKVLDEANPAS
jgi:hypothetical protein